MVAIVASLRSLQLTSARHLPAKLWWLPAAALTLAVAAGGALTGQSVAGDLLDWALFLLLALAFSADRRELHLRAIPLGPALLWSVFGVVICAEVLSAGLRLEHWDLLFDTGVLAFVIALEMESKLHRRLTVAVTRLADRGVLVVTRDARNRGALQLDPRPGKRAWVAGPLLALIILLAWIAAFIFAYGTRTVASNLGWILFQPQILFECLAGWIAGVKIADMIAVNRSWRSMSANGIGWRLMPGHPDGAAGFKPIGDFFFYQCMIAAIPAIYIAVWWWLIPLVRSFHAYALWREPYLFLLIAAIAIEVTVFVRPMYWVHGIMHAEKAKLLPRADRLSIRLDSLQRRLSGGFRSPSDYQKISESITELTQESQRIEHAPTWPIDSSIRRRFNLSNLALLLPFVGYAVGGTTLWQQISDAIQGIGK